MPYFINSISIEFKCSQCSLHDSYRSNSLNDVLEKAKKAGWKFPWKFPWKLETIKPTIYDSDEECLCPACSQVNEVRCNNPHTVIDRYIVKFPPGDTVLDGKSKSNSTLALEILEMLRGKGDIYFCDVNFTGWKVLHQIGSKYIELIPQTSFTEKEV